MDEIQGIGGTGSTSTSARRAVGAIEECVRRHDRRPVRQKSVAETAAEDRETPPVVVSESKTLIAQMGLQDGGATKSPCGGQAIT